MTLLSTFLQQLFTSGQVSIQGKIGPFDAADEAAGLQLLESLYEEDKLEMPGNPPPFDASAALWAARYLYTALQLVAIRDIETEKLLAYMPTFTGAITPSVIYAADLVLRHLPQVIHLAKGLAPADAVVALLLQTAQQWPFSSVGLPLETPPDESLILQHSSLRRVYADRIIQMKDLNRIHNNPSVKAAVQEALGNYADTFWPKFTLQES